MIKKLSLVCIALFTLVALSVPAFAGKKKSGGAAKAAKGDSITSVSDTSITTSAGKTFSITAETKITLDGAEAKASDLKDGMKVTVTPSSDESKAATIEAKAAEAKESKEKAGKEDE